MANIDKLARFIASLGSLNEYGSTIAQTKKALETENLTYLSSQNRPSHLSGCSERD